MSPLVVVKQVTLHGEGTVGKLQVEVRQESPPVVGTVEKLQVEVKWENLQVVGTGEILQVAGTAVIPQAEGTDVTGQAEARSVNSLHFNILSPARLRLKLNALNFQLHFTVDLTSSLTLPLYTYKIRILSIVTFSHIFSIASNLIIF